MILPWQHGLFCVFMRILTVEDDKIIGDAIIQGLRMDGYASDWVEDIESADTAISSHLYDLLILDIGLPDGSGLDLLDKLRKQDNSIPILVLTAYDDVATKVRALDTGADDYLIKPFDLNELLARLRALKRRSLGRVTPKLRYHNIELDPATKIVTKAGKKIILGAKEFAILQTLMEKQGYIVSKTQIEDGLYGWDIEIASNTVEVHVHGLRQKLGKDFIKTIRHSGYMIGASCE